MAEYDSAEVGYKLLGRKVRFVLWIILAILCLAYGVIVAAVNSGTGFFVVWIVFAAMFGLFAAAAHFELWNRMPGAVRIWVLIIFCGLLAFFIIIECLIITRFNEKGEEGLDYVIVLGSQVYIDRPSTVLKYRLDKAIEYLNENPETICIVSGGQGDNEPIPEAAGMADYLMKNGISSDRIIQEPDSLTTVQNIENCMKLIEPESRVGIITNDFHMFRALQIAKSAGLDTCGISAESTPLYLPNNMLREFFAEVLFLIRRI